jgi:hypothetical protein
VLTGDGAWCWFADPRGVHFAGARDCTYVGWVTSCGDIVVGQFDHASRRMTQHVVRERLEKDDHANPALWIDGNGRITVIYTKHAGEALYARTTDRSEDISAWSAERTFRPNAGSYGRNKYCYPNPYPLAAEDDRIYLLWRGDHWKPTLSTSDDGGQTWSVGRILVMREGARPGNRPYLKAASDGRDTIHLAFTDGHPRNEPQNSIYYARYRGGAFTRADGSSITPLAKLPFAPRDADIVYDGRKTGVRAWIWDVAADPQGRPVVVYARLPEEGDHRYHYARWDGRRWIDHEITVAGRWFPQTPSGKREREPHYSGGVVLDHEDIGVVYLSRQVDGVFEIEQWRTRDFGKTWTSAAVTEHSSQDNVRPYVVRNHGEDGPIVIWMCIDGEYVHYTNYRTSLHMAEAPR